MSRQVFELETVMQSLIDEHEKLLGHLERHQAAMKAFDARQIDDLGIRQESTRLRIAQLEVRRKGLAQAIARSHRATQEPTLGMIAALYPPSAARLLKQREQLKDLAQQVARKSFVAGRLAGAVLGHLNTVVRLLAGAVEKAGLYTKQGVPQVSCRIGVMEAVG